MKKIQNFSLISVKLCCLVKSTLGHEVRIPLQHLHKVLQSLEVNSAGKQTFNSSTAHNLPCFITYPEYRSIGQYLLVILTLPS